MLDSYMDFKTLTSVNLIGEGDTWIITSVETNRKHRGKGGARKVMEHVCADADREGSLLMLSVDPQEPVVTKERLRAFYASLGFVEIPDGEDAMGRAPRRSDGPDSSA